MTRSTSGMPTDGQHRPDAVAVAASPRSRSWAASTSRIWAPMVNTGLNADVGFWKIMATWRTPDPPQRRSSRVEQVAARRTAAHRPTAGQSAAAGASPRGPVTVLPQPVSPTTPTASPGADDEVDAVERDRVGAPRPGTRGAGPGSRARVGPGSRRLRHAGGRRAAHRPCLGSSTRSSTSPTRLKASTVTKMARPGNVATHHWSRMTVRPVGDHQAPVGRGRPGAQADERQRAGGEDDRADVDGRLDHDGRQRVGHDVAPMMRQVANADGARRVDERLLPQGHRHRPRDAGVPRPPAR